MLAGGGARKEVAGGVSGGVRGEWRGERASLVSLSVAMFAMAVTRRRWWKKSRSLAAEIHFIFFFMKIISLNREPS